MPTKVWIVAGPEWKVVSAQLRTVDNQLPKWIEDELDNAIGPVVRKAQGRVLHTDVVGGPAGHTGLRGRVAAGVGYRKGISSKSNAYFRIYTSMADQSESSIPRGLDSPKGWRHPLFGNKDHWYTSTPANPGWFTDTISDSADTIERAIARALERAEHFVGGAK